MGAYGERRREMRQALEQTVSPSVRTIAPRAGAGSDGSEDISVTDVVSKTANENRNSTTTFATDGQLFFSIAVGEKASFRFRVWWNTPAAADFKYQITFPAGADIWMTVKELAPGATALVCSLDTNTTAHVALGTVTNGYVEIEGRINNPTNAGQVAFQWAQNTSNASDTAVLQGSDLTVTKH